MPKWVCKEKLMKLVREAGLEPARPKTQVPKTCVSAISPLPQKSVVPTASLASESLLLGKSHRIVI